MDYCRITPDVKLGENVVINAFVNLYGCTISNNTKIGTFVEIQKGVSVGENCKISSHSFICEGVTISDNVFIGHGVMFINDVLPRATNSNSQLMSADEWNVVSTHIDKGVSLGSNVTVMCGITIGEGALIGAGSVVTKDIPPMEIWAGNPAKFFRKIEY
jgi:UDP-2-acetamido-3-amino-2,3-dideoxy-glucuronate N-acetyltransferase